jgi:hypothetical protein
VSHRLARWLGPWHNNARSLLFGCNQGQHKRQNFARKLGRERWRQLSHGLWNTPKERMATLSCEGSALSGFVAVAALIVN